MKSSTDSTKSNGFDLQHILQELKHYLPSQTPLKDFIHHNTLHAFQDLTFYDAIFKASEMFGYRVTFHINEYRNLHKIGRIREAIIERVIENRKGKAFISVWKEKMLNGDYGSFGKPRIGQLRAYWKSDRHIDLDNLVQPLLFRIISSYLDQGIALWQFPFEDEGLLYAMRKLEGNGFSSFFTSKRAKEMLFDESCTIEQLLKIVVGDGALYEQYLFDQQFSHRGWSGMVGVIEDNPDSVLYPKKISLQEFIFLELLLEINALDRSFGEADWKPLGFSKIKPIDLFAKIEKTELHDVLSLWQNAFEWNYYDEVLSGLKHAKVVPQKFQIQKTKRFQAVFCIDEREDSLRRHLESCEPNCETLGCPGFFGVEFYFQPQNSVFYEKLCPAPVTPVYLIKEYDAKSHNKHELLYTKRTHQFFQGFLISLSLGFVAAFRLLQNVLNPKKRPAAADSFDYMHKDGKLLIENTDTSLKENGLQVGFTVAEMATRVENLFRGIGMVKDFAPIFYVVGHGSSSANNPYYGAYNCGACSGRPGAVNARVLAAMANHPGVRVILAEKGILIPETTQFIGALHDTASDDIAFYDTDILNAVNAKSHLSISKSFEDALDLNAKERSRRFESIDTSLDIKKVRKAIRRRSVSIFEPRPEFGHGTNALCFVGHRSLTVNLFLDRRAFMNSYDYRTDPDGKFLLGVMRPIPPVCGGINLEYYFSRMDNYKLGAGTKLPHNVVGLIGVANSSDGDLRTGLPSQTVEVHDPIRLMILVEHYPEVILKTLQSDPVLYQWFVNEWVFLVAVHPTDNTFYHLKEGEFKLYTPLDEDARHVGDVHQFLESAKGMDSNHILDATKENLPIHVIKK